MGRAYPEVTPAILPSSLSISYLDCLSILYFPTSVWSEYELCIHKFSGFSWHRNDKNNSSRGNPSWLSLTSTKTDLPVSACPINRTCLTLSTPHILAGLLQITMRYHITAYIGARILTSYPSAFRFRKNLRSRLTLRRWTLRRNSEGFGRPNFHRPTLLMSALLLPQAPALFTQHLQRVRDTLLPPHTIAGVGLQLRYIAWAPLHFRRIFACPVSCYAFFKGLLLLSKPPGC